nr:MAG TPA: hypothetical protein [Caudoviricetes sp.]
MIELFKRTKLLSSICFISFIISIARVLSSDTQELFNGAEEWFAFADNLSLAYIASYFFYIVQVYLPELRAEKAALPRRCAVQREVQLFISQYINIWERINRAGKKGPAEKDIKVIFSSENLLENSKKINLDEESDALNLYKNRNATWEEEISGYVRNMNERGLEILRYNKDFIPCNVYYAIYGMLNESLLSNISNLFKILPISSFQTLYQCLPKDSNGKINGDKDIRMLEVVINWVNEEYELLTSKMDTKDKKTIFRSTYDS